MCDRAWQAKDDGLRHRLSNAILTWADQIRVARHYIAPSKPMQNALIERVNGQLRDELPTPASGLDAGGPITAAHQNTHLFMLMK